MIIMVDARKIQWVEQIEELASQNRYMVFADFCGLSVEALESLRRELYELDSKFCVVKNRLAKIAFERLSNGSESAIQQPEVASDSSEQFQLEEIKGLGPSKVEAFREAGFNSPVKVAEASSSELQQITGVGPALAEKLKTAAAELLGSAEETVEKSESDQPAPSRASLASQVEPFLSGNTAVVFADREISLVAKAIFDFKERTENLEVKAGLIEEEVFETEKLEAIAELPPRKQLLTALAISLNSPIQKLARYLADPIYKFVDVLNQVKSQKENCKE